MTYKTKNYAYIKAA